MCWELNPTLNFRKTSWRVFSMQRSYSTGITLFQCALVGDPGNRRADGNCGILFNTVRRKNAYLGALVAEVLEPARLRDRRSYLIKELAHK